MTMPTVNAKNIIITLAGVRIEGFADGDFLNIEHEDSYADVVGSDGLVARSASNDGRATITLTLLQTSPSNDFLDALHTADINAPNGAGVGPFTMSDLFGRSEAFAPETWIQKKPSVVFGREVGDREWVLRCAKLTTKVYGA